MPSDDEFLTTRRLRMRRVEDGDLGLFARVFCDEGMMRHLGSAWTLDLASETLREWKHEWGRDSCYYGVLVTAQGDAVVGIAGISEDTVPEQPGVELSWFILPEHQRQGYATEIGEALMEVAFGRMKRRRMVAETHPANEAAAATLRKMGWRRVGETCRWIEYLPEMDRQVLWECRREA